LKQVSIARTVQQAIRCLANPAKAKVLQRFFKTGPGEYGEGDQFLGLTAAQSHGLAKQFQELPLPEIAQLLKSKVHEDRLVAGLILVLQFQKYENKQKNIFKFYLKNRRGFNNWDLIDSTAPLIVGASLYRDASERNLLKKLAKSKNLWDRRIAMLGTFYFIRQDQFSPTLQVAKMLIKDEEDLIHKASGWMLREIGKRDIKPLLKFLDQYSKQMPRTMLRYSIEKLSASQRAYYMRRA
jgi:3-methyladenine DNA glycosylase AlkD